MQTEIYTDTLTGSWLGVIIETMHCVIVVPITSIEHSVYRTCTAVYVSTHTTCTVLYIVYV